MSILSILSQEQYLAATSLAQNNLILAGAGTGKTRTLMGRVEFLTQHQGVSGDRILMLAFTQKAAQEMQERLDKVMQGSSHRVQVRTFHSLGLHITQQVQKKRLSLHRYHSEEAFAQFVYQRFLHHCAYNSQYLDAYYAWINVGQFYLHTPSYRTLNDDAVLNLPELQCANTLYALGLHALYKAVYCPTVIHKPFARYAPYRESFYLPQEDCYIAVYTNEPHDYRQAVRAIHQQHGTQLIELSSTGDPDTDYFSFKEILENHFKSRLKQFKIKQLARTPFYYEEQINCMVQLLHRLRNHSPWCSLDEKIGKASTYLEPLLKPIWQDYQHYLTHCEGVDYEQMILKATQAIKNKTFTLPWDFVMIDEFQDISADRAELILAMQAQKPRIHLCCVGDDWQSIYRFSGSDIHYTSYFDRFFGKTERFYLSQTYRFNQALSDLSSRFVLQNPLQSRKTLHGVKNKVQPVQIRGSSYGIDQVLEEIVAQQQEMQSVLILARFHFLLPSPRQLAQLQKQYPQLQLEANSVHGVKGNEADQVIVIGLGQGEFGFPSEKTSPPWVEAFLPEQETFKFAEERRLFYVAITRTRHAVYLLYDEENPSHFVQELQALMKK